MKHIPSFLGIALCLLLFSGCIFGNSAVFPGYTEDRIGLIGTNIIGIAGEVSDEPYIEIQYSTADEENPGQNKIASLWVSPPYIFQNNNVYIEYNYLEWNDNLGPYAYEKALKRNFDEGGAEYLRIINHSSDKSAEFFIAGVPSEKLGYRDIPYVRYRNASIYFLLNPERKPANNVRMDDAGWIIYFEGNRIGDLAVTEAWTVDEVAALYRAEYARSNEIQLVIADNDYRMIDLINGYIDTHRGFRGFIFHGIINPKEEIQGSDRIWLLATDQPIFSEHDNVFEEGSLR